MSDLARRYARALYESGDPPVEETLLREICDEITNCKPLWELLRDPVIHHTEKTAVLEALPLLTDQPHLLRLFCVLAQKQRLRLIPEVMGAYYGLMLNEKKIAHCKLISARPLDEAQLARLRAFLCNEHGVNDVNFDQVIDESLLGGFILNILGMTYDHSVRGRFSGLSRYLNEVNTL